MELFHYSSTMKISTEQKLDNFRNMHSMIEDYRKQHNRFPTLKEFEEKLGMSEATVKRYKRIILDQQKSLLLKTFQDEMVYRVGDAIKSIDKNVGIFETIRDETNDDDTKMSAGKIVIESKLDAIRIMRDGPDFLGINYDVSNEQEHIHEENIREDRIRESIKSTFH